MDIRSISMKDRQNPYVMAKHYMENNSVHFIEKTRFLEKNYSLDEVDDMIILLELLKKDDNYLLNFLKSVKIKELNDIDLLVDKSLKELEESNSEDENIKNYLENEMKSKIPSLEKIENDENFNIENTLMILQKENDDLNKKLENPKTFNSFKLLVDKKKSVVKLSAIYLSKSNINKMSNLDIKKPVSFIIEILNNKRYRDMLPIIKQEKEVENVRKRKKEGNGLRFRPKMVLKK